MATYKNISSISSKPNWKATVCLGYDNGQKKVSRKQGFNTKKDAEKWVTEILNKKIKDILLQQEVIYPLKII